MQRLQAEFEKSKVFQNYFLENSDFFLSFRKFSKAFDTFFFNFLGFSKLFQYFNVFFPQKIRKY